ncbi:phage head-tail adapter protein, partial [Listeria monocytogenes]|nr:phage head-tail adapter protein [Listeria monocytogenes]
MWDLEIDLLKEDGFTSDQIGNQILKYKRSTVMGYED